VETVQESTEVEPETKRKVRPLLARFIRYSVRQYRRRKYEKRPEAPADKAARRTANATVAIALFTLVSVLVSYVQWKEIREGGRDTHNLATAAGIQAKWTRNLANSMQTQADRTKDLADQMKNQADRTNTIAEQAIVQANAAKSAADTAKEALHISERAYVHAGFPLVRWDKKAIYIPLQNNGRIPSGPVHIVLHIQKNTKSSDGGTYTESRWMEQSIKSIALGETVTTPGVGFDPSLVRSGKQWFTLGIVVEYNDGFSDTRSRSEESAFCSNYSKGEGFVISPCIFANILNLLKNADGYPNPKNEIYEYQNQNLEYQMVAPK
jgi:hypothetical protein